VLRKGVSLGNSRISRALSTVLQIDYARGVQLFKVKW
jgi:hypothetical protein